MVLSPVHRASDPSRILYVALRLLVNGVEQQIRVDVFPNCYGPGVTDWDVSLSCAY
jgi:hypothetical protein